MPDLGNIESALRSKIDRGEKALVVYITGGLGNDWIQTINAAVSAGADVIEVGIPFSDPVMDGPIIQEANDLALKQGTTPISILNELRNEKINAPLAVMTYYNLVYRMGLERFASDLIKSGISGCILPDLPLEELSPWAEAAESQSVESILLASPTAPDERLPIICENSKGFVYAVGLLGVTGVREVLASSAVEIAKRLKKVTRKPVLVGVGIGTPEQAVEAAQESDGVIVGSAVVKKMIDGSGPDGVGDLVLEFRKALDKGL